MNEHAKSQWKDAFKFGIYILPVAIIAGIAIAFYTLDVGMIHLEETGLTKSTVVVSVMIQTIFYAFVSAVFGWVLANKVGLKKEIRITKQNAAIAILCGAGCGILFFVLEWTIFRRIIPQVDNYYQSYKFTFADFISKLTYAGVVEELLMRWFLMSLIALILWKLFARKVTRENIPIWIFIISNIAVALVFSLGHLPATLALFGEINGVILIRCLLLNGSFGLVYGWLYRTKGIQYAMIAHALSHVFCDGLFFMVLHVM